MLKSESFPERIALIEFDSSHDECLLSQINALRERGCWILLVTNKTIRNRNQYLMPLVNEWIDIDFRDSDSHRNGLTGAAIGDALIIRRLMRKLKAEKIDRVVFNTAQGGHVRNACLFSLFRKIEFVGIIHTTRKFQGSFTQKVISLKIKKYFVLGEFLLDQIPNTSTPLGIRNLIKIESFYPIDFPKGDQIIETNNTHISLIGSVEKRRKDLDGFISLIQQCDSSVRFSFLGKADPNHHDVIEFKKKLAEINCLGRVQFFENYACSETINQILRKTIAILPIVHPNTPSAAEYFRHQIPGAMNIALGYTIPLLLHDSFRNIEELNSASVYYTMDSFTSALNELISNKDAIQTRMKQTEQFTSNYQQNKFLKFLFDR